MPRIGNYTEEETRSVLEQYILPKECAADPFTTDLRPEWVSKFVRDSVRKDLSGRPMRRATDVVRFYALRDRIDQLAGFFAHNEKPRPILNVPASLSSRSASSVRRPSRARP
jgi:hypothetical protein